MRRPRLPLAGARLPYLALAVLLSACGDDGGPTEPEPEQTNEAPEAEIFSPEADVVFEYGEEIVFHGEAQDPEDGTLAGASLVWTSDLDGEIGTGLEFSRSDLSVGRHQIILEAEDSEGAVGKDGKFISVAEEPDVDLVAHLPRPDLPAESAEPEITIADGEAFVLRWEVSGGPNNTCHASGDWSGSRSDAGADTSGANTGPASFTYVLECENAVGADTDTATVSVGAPGEVRARSDRLDETEQERVKLYYMVPKDGGDRELDLDGSLKGGFQRFQDRFESETERRFRVDTYTDASGEKRFDITFVEVDYSNYPDRPEHNARQDELIKRGFYRNGDSSKVTLVYYDGPKERGRCGTGGNLIAWVWLQACSDLLGSLSGIAGHEVLHALGFVDKDAPDYITSHHVSQPEDDLMYQEVDPNFVVDPNCRNYFCPEGLPSHIKNLAESPYLVP